MANPLERKLGFKINWLKFVVLLSIPVLIVLALLLTNVDLPGTSPQEKFERQEERFEERIEQGQVEPVLTQDVKVTAEGIEPQFALIRYTPEVGTAQVRITNTDSRTRIIVVGQNDVRELTPGYEFILTFGRPTELEIWDKENPDIRGKIFVREV